MKRERGEVTRNGNVEWETTHTKHLHHMLANYWTDADNCRAFFNEYAKENAFDPLSAEHWYSVQVSSVRAKKV